MDKSQGGGRAPYAKHNKSSFIYPEVEEISRARREGRDEEADRLGDKHTAKHLSKKNFEWLRDHGLLSERPR